MEKRPGNGALCLGGGGVVNGRGKEVETDVLELAAGVDLALEGVAKSK